MNYLRSGKPGGRSHKKSSRPGSPGFLAQGDATSPFFRLELDHEIHRPIHDPSHLDGIRHAQRGDAIRSIIRFHRASRGQDLRYPLGQDP